MAARREVWDELGGLEEELFAYYEDADLSLRCWQRGWQVIYVPTAVVVHRYEFSRNPVKFRLLERNRLTMVLTEFGPRHLALVAPALAVLEVGMIGYAAADGWLGAKLSAYGWLWRHRGWLRQRRRPRCRRRGVVPEHELAWLFADHLQPGNLPPPGPWCPSTGCCGPTGTWSAACSDPPSCDRPPAGSGSRHAGRVRCAGAPR